MPTENPLHDWLASLTGSLQTDQPTNESTAQIEELFKHLSLALPSSFQISDTRLPQFAFEKIQPSTIASLHPDIREKVLQLSGQEGIRDNEFKVFMRESPVRDVNALRSTPSWASGAAVDRTFGPFLNVDGRRVWFDFFKVEKLVALYNNAGSFPALLFNVTVSKLWSQENTALLASAQQEYNLTADSSIWILSTLLAANAPAGKYTGLTIKSGTISVNEMPVINAGKTTVSATAVVTVKLKLRQQEVTDADPTSPFGEDARAAEYTLPDMLEFHFSAAAGSKTDAIGNSQSLIFGQTIMYEWVGTPGNYNKDIAQLGYPLKASESEVIINKSASPFTQFSGRAKLLIPYWGLPIADLDLAHISPAAGIGGIGLICDKGLSATWTGLQHGPVALNLVLIGAQPGVVGLATGLAGNLYSKQTFTMWYDDVEDKIPTLISRPKKYPSTVSIDFGKQFKFQFFSTANGNELLEANVNANVDADRPIDVSARPISIHTKDSSFLLMANKNFKAVLLYDNNIIADNFTVDPNNPQSAFDLKTMSLALENALFTTSEVNGVFLSGELDDDWKKINKGLLFTAFAVYKYIPTLPDPYAANVGIFQKFIDFRVTDNITIKVPVMVLLCQVKFNVTAPEQPDNVEVSFHLLPFVLPQAQQTKLTAFQGTFDQPEHDPEVNIAAFSHNAVAAQRNDWTTLLDTYFKDDFALLDVSSSANQMGISFGSFGGRKGRTSLLTQFGVSDEGENIQSLYTVPFKIDNVQVTSPGLFTRSFVLPHIAWEPVHNLTKPDTPNDPPKGLNFYPDDGGSTRIFNNNLQYVPLAPKPVIKDIIKRYKGEPGNVTWSYFTLPFGLKAIALMSRDKQGASAPTLEFTLPLFKDDLRGGIQIQCSAGLLSTDKFPMFNGMTMQLPNVLDANGTLTGTGTLGQSVATIFNTEFGPHGKPLIENRGVPLSRIDFSGYGASMFNNWSNPYAQIAQTSQTKFDVFTGRTAHEVVQVRSIVYPWGIHVVRTIVLYRTNTGYVYRVDTGWQAESDGLFNFNYNLLIPPETENTTAIASQYDIHPGLVRGLFNIKNIVEVNELPFNTNSVVQKDQFYLTGDNEVKQAPHDIIQAAKLQKITFDADVEIDGVIQGAVNGRTASKGVVGYVQLAPMGVPLSAAAFTQLIAHAGGSMGGPVNCVVDVNNSSQQMRINRIDVTCETNANTNHVFVTAARGSAILPKDGSWSMVTHTASSGKVSPLPENITIPLIRIGKLEMTGSKGDAAILTDVSKQLVRIANPTEILRSPSADTINYGLLQNTGTQKVLFLTPSFESGVQQLMSKTPPLMADAYRMMTSKAIFPNIGDAVTNFGDAISFGLDKFNPGALADGLAPVHQLMKVAANVADAAGQLQDQAYKLLKKIEDPFELNLDDVYLIKEDFLKIYIQYKAQPNKQPLVSSKLDFDIDSLAGNAVDKWKSKLNNLAMVIDLGPLTALMTIKGNFNAKKSQESGFGGDETGSGILPVPELQFSSALQAAIDILQILQDLSGGDYKAALKKGLKVAMSNSAGTWEYKFEAAKEIPVIKFPFGPLYEDPTQPLKLEASLKVGMYFNAALMVTTDVKKLLPTAGAFVDFYGQVRVMCVSLAAATVYAVGQVNLGIAGDTAKGPSLHMKFGFGVQLVVGLPVVGNVSVMYMAGVELYIDKDKVAASVFMLFRGHAELLGGLVGVTITIEAKGTIIRENNRTDCQAQVTFSIDISIFLVIDIDFSESWEESRQIA